MSTEALHRLIFKPEPQPATEHPVRCSARLSFAVIGDHTHECIHPAKRPEGVVGVLEHQCHCGATWSERGETGEQAGDAR
jgi:hypothetical protein